MYKLIYLIGAGQIGSRHLQALKAISMPLDITVVDPSSESLKIAKERYKQMPATKNSARPTQHKLSYVKALPTTKKSIDLAIIATSSNTRANATRNLLKNNDVKHLILEKLLFSKKTDYLSIGNMLKEKKIKTWVNCPLRIMPFYRDMKTKTTNPLQYRVSGNQSGLCTDTIHFIDHIAYLTGCHEFSVDTSGLDTHIKDSKRNGFIELTGTLSIKFSDGTLAIFNCPNEGTVPKLVEIFSNELRIIAKEYELKAWIANGKSDWKWHEENISIPYQSHLTTKTAQTILTNSSCELTPFEESANLHIQFLEPLKKFINKVSPKKYNYYPFT